MGLQKRIHQADKTNYALEHGEYWMSPVTLARRARFSRPMTPTPVSAGVLRAKARLDAHRKAQAERLAGVM